MLATSASHLRATAAAATSSTPSTLAKQLHQSHRILLNRSAANGQQLNIVMRFASANNGGGRMADMGPTVTEPRQVTQDMPPPGGFRPVRIRRNNPKKFWKGTTVAVVGMFIMAFGWYNYFFRYAHMNQLEHEKYLLTELAMNPFLQSEKDIILAVERRAFRKKVAELKEVDEELKNDETFTPEWDQFFALAKKYTYPFNEPQRYVTKENLSVTFKGTGLLEREKQYLEKLRQM